MSRQRSCSLSHSFSDENFQNSDVSFRRVQRHRRGYSDDLSHFINDIRCEETSYDTTFFRSRTLDFPSPSNLCSSTPVGQEDRDSSGRTTFSPNDFLQRAIGEDANSSIKTTIFVANAQVASASNALTWCKTSRKFFYSRERIEAERIWLLAERRCEQIHLHGVKNAIGINNSPKGSLIFQDITLPLKPEKTLQASSCWYLVEFNINEKVFMTNATTGVPVFGLENRPEIIFPGDSIHLKDLNKNFLLHIRIYELNLTRLKFDKGPKKFFRLLMSRLLKRSCREEREPDEGEKFVLIAEAKFQLQDLLACSHLNIEEISADSVLQGSLDTRVVSCVHLGSSTVHMGFVNSAICTSQGEIRHWDLLWCILEDCMMRFWYYPNHVEFLSPIFSIDLNRCLLKRITFASRSDCPRPRSLFIRTCKEDDITQPHHCQPQKYFISIDKEDELTRWIEKLNVTLEAVQSWQLERQCLLKTNI